MANKMENIFIIICAFCIAYVCRKPILVKYRETILIYNVPNIYYTHIHKSKIVMFQLMYIPISRSKQITKFKSNWILCRQIRDRRYPAGEYPDFHTLAVTRSLYNNILNIKNKHTYCIYLNFL